MIRIDEKNTFREICTQIGQTSHFLSCVPTSVSETAREIRLRAGKPPVIEYENGHYVVSGHTVTREDIDDCMKSLCSYSVYNFEKEYREGYITLRGGHRAGFCGTATVRSGAIDNIRMISSINIRIAREYIGCGESLSHIVRSDRLRGLLITGRPMSGKTTVLRDISRILGQDRKIAIIDSRSEISAVYNGVAQNNVGNNADILNGYPKAEAITIAVRVLSPEYIICDEVTGEEDAISECLNCGVRIIATAHCSSFEEAKRLSILKSGAFNYIALLGTGERIGQVEEIRKIDEL